MQLLTRTPRTPCASLRARPQRAGAVLVVALVALGGCKQEPSATPDVDSELPGELDAPPVAPLDRRVEAAQALIAKGSYQEALDDMEVALVDEADHADLHYGRAVALSFLERDDEALAAYGRALELNPELVPALVARGNMYAFAMGEVDKARSDFDAAVRLAPKFAPGFHGRGVIRFDTNDVAGAIEDLSQAAELDPANVNSLYILSQAHAAAGDAKSALAAASRAVEIEPGSSGADLRLLKAKLLFANNDAPGAIAEYQALAEVVPDAPDVRLQVGRGILQAGDPEAAIAHFEAVAAALPDQPAPLVNWARALAAKGDSEGAVVKLDAALALDAKLPAAHVYKIEILAAAGECKAAKSAHQVFGKTGPKADALARSQAAVDSCKAP